MIIISVITTLLMQILFGQAEENLNQQIINLILSKHPVSSFFWIVLLGPLVEELTYRVGLFNAISSRNRIAAYVVSALVFGFLHFNIHNADGAIDQAKLIEEFINILVTLLADSSLAIFMKRRVCWVKCCLSQTI